ncbi:MAG: hypothetical protein H0W65_05740 [Sphingomonas sp.]|nr:hypothetical protein [Sphingomonas sp.]MBA3667205.1 hypothetical protein [Sphingomonas sp.]
MSVVAILVAVVLAFLAFRFVTGMIKFLLIGVVLIAVAWFLLHGGAG